MKGLLHWFKSSTKMKRWMFIILIGIILTCYGIAEILEDNARGFFRISENPNNLKRCPVFIQTKSGMIYRVRELFRQETSSNLKSTIRYFNVNESFTKDEFIDAIKNDNIKQHNDSAPSSLIELWDSSYKWMIVENTNTHKTIMINRDQNNNMLRSFNNNCIQYKYVTCLDQEALFYTINSQKEYSIRDDKALSKIWRLIRAK